METANKNLIYSMNQTKSKELHLGLCVGLVCLTEEASIIDCLLCGSQAKFSELPNFISHIAREHDCTSGREVDDAGNIKSEFIDEGLLEQFKENRSSYETAPKYYLQRMDESKFTKEAIPDSTTLKIMQKEIGNESNTNIVKDEKEYINILEINSKEFYCNHCKKIFLSRKEVMDHICSNVTCTFADTVAKQKQPIPLGGIIYKCEICEKIFPTIRGFRTHKTRTHSKSVVCKAEKIRIDGSETKSSVPQKSKNIVDKAYCESLKKSIEQTETEIFKQSLKENTFNFPTQNESYLSNQTELNVRKFEQNEKQLFSADESDANKFYCGKCDTSFNFENELLKHVCLNDESFSVDAIKREGGTAVIENNNQYCCKICPAKLKTRKILKNHMKIHNANPPFKCMYCPQRCISSSGLKQHLKTHEPSSGETYSCPHCPATRKSQGALTCHLQTHNDQKSFICDYCNHSYNTAFKLRAHLKKVHATTIGIEFPCTLCSAILNSRKSLNRHILKHKGEKSYKCEHCSRAFYRSDLLSIHMVTHSGKKSYKCEQCSKAFYFKSNLKKHMITHSGKKPYKCDKCSSAYYFKNNLRQHMITHSEKKPYKCDQCARVFKLSAQLKRHISIHNGERSYKCEECSSAFHHKYELKIHMGIHSEIKPYKCEQCSRGFIHSYYLKRHMKIHSEKKAFKCEQCSSEFDFKYKLKEHMIRHSGEKPYNCDQCSSAFYLKHDLKRHLIIHSGKKSYKCPQCERGFTHSSYLRNHMVTHSENKPFTCEQCSRGFTRSLYLHKHLLTHSENKPYKCEHCSRAFYRSDQLKRHILTYSVKKPYKSEPRSSDFCVKDDLQNHMLIHSRTT